MTVLYANADFLVTTLGTYEEILKAQLLVSCDCFQFKWTAGKYLHGCLGHLRGLREQASLVGGMSRGAVERDGDSLADDLGGMVWDCDGRHDRNVLGDSVCTGDCVASA